jgi:predicted GNAT family acetyltransferase
MEEPRVVDNPDVPRYELYVGDDLAGVLLYSRRNGTIALIHTEVDQAFEGRGLASRLIAGALEDIRRQGLEMVPVCPFVRSYLARHVTTG